MTILGMPPSMFVIFVATVAAGCVGAVHYLVVHVLLGRPFGDEGEAAVSRGDVPDGSAPDGLDGDPVGEGMSEAALSGHASPGYESERREGK